jgi:hypothetical protein
MTDKMINLDADMWNAPEHEHQEMLSEIIATSPNSDKVKQLVMDLYLDNLNYRDAKTGKIDEFYSSAASPFYARVAIVGFMLNGKLPNEHMFKIEMYIPDALLEAYKVKALALKEENGDAVVFKQEMKMNDHFLFELMTLLMDRAKLDVNKAAKEIRNIAKTGKSVYLQNDLAFQNKLNEIGVERNKRHITVLELDYATQQLRLDAVQGLIDGGHTAAQSFDIVCRSEGKNLKNIVAVANRERQKLKDQVERDQSAIRLQAPELPEALLHHSTEDSESEEKVEPQHEITHSTKLHGSSTLSTASQSNAYTSESILRPAPSDVSNALTQSNAMPTSNLIHVPVAALGLLCIGLLFVFRKPLVRLFGSCTKRNKHKGFFAANDTQISDEDEAKKSLVDLENGETRKVKINHARSQGRSIFTSKPHGHEYAIAEVRMKTTTTIRITKAIF